MKRKYLYALPLIGAITIPCHAQAASVNFFFTGGGITGSGTFTVAADSHASSSFGMGTKPNSTGPGYFGLADPLNALQITGAIGNFSDTVLGISNVAITGVVTNDYLPHFDNDPTIPYSFSWWPGTGYPTSGTVLSYDNLFYPGAAAPETCEGVPSGGYLDDYGVMLTLANNDVVDVYSDGGGGVGSTIYGAAVANTMSGMILHYDDNCISAEICIGAMTLSAPEPSTWAMMVLGFAGLGYAGVRKARRAATVA